MSINTFDQFRLEHTAMYTVASVYAFQNNEFYAGHFTAQYSMLIMIMIITCLFVYFCRKIMVLPKGSPFSR